jgi:hypothetical protein
MLNKKNPLEMKIKKMKEMYEGDKIPTASEFFRNKPNGSDDIEYWAIEFTKIHVDAALRNIHKCLGLPKEELDIILHSYPLNNIK